jgi:hypothetical protein
MEQSAAQQPTGACDIVQAWLKHNAKYLGIERQLESLTGPLRKLTAGYETPTHLIFISAADNGSCIDIDTLDKATKTVEMISAGGCKDQADILNRLDTLIQRLVAYRKATNLKWIGP